MAAQVKVYHPKHAPKGALHTIPNARDLVSHAGWTYKPGREYTPADNVPFASAKGASKADEVAKVQSIIDGAGVPQANASASHQAQPGVHIAESERVEIVYGDDAPTAPAADDGDEEFEDEPEVAAPVKKTRVKKAAE